MHQTGMLRQYPELKQIVVEASRALAMLDAVRLEELALSCRALNRDLAFASADDRSQLARESQEAVGEMAVLGRVLDVTRSNLTVLNRLRELRSGRLEYNERQAGWGQTETQHGDN